MNPVVPPTPSTRARRLVLPLLGASLLAGTAAHAFPIAPLGTEGFAVVVASTDPIIATYEGNSATYSNDLYLALDGTGSPGLDGDSSNDLFIFNNHASAVGATASLGSFPLGTELIFRLYVNNTGYDYFSGAASRNPDGLPHARVQSDWAPGTTLVSFEDLYGTPEAPGGYNDLSFSFLNTRGVGLPDSMTTSLGLGLSCAGLWAAARRRRSLA